MSQKSAAESSSLTGICNVAWDQQNGNARSGNGNHIVLSFVLAQTWIGRGRPSALEPVPAGVSAEDTGVSAEDAMPLPVHTVTGI